MNREEYLKERELNALERIAESLEATAYRVESIAESLDSIASYICKDDAVMTVMKVEPDTNSKYPGMEVSYL